MGESRERASLATARGRLFSVAAVFALLTALIWPAAGGAGASQLPPTEPAERPEVPGARAVEAGQQARLGAPTGFLFGVYPGGGTGETPDVPNPDPGKVDAALAALAGGKPLAVHLYTAWSWHDDALLDEQIGRFSRAGLGIILSIKYSPPPDRAGDLPGYEAFVRSVVSRHATNPAVVAFVVGNEANVSGNPEASDGPFPDARRAVVRGVVAARQEVARHQSAARVGFNLALTSQSADTAFLQDLVGLGGEEFVRSTQFVGLNLYPGIWPASAEEPYVAMSRGLESARASVDAVPGLRGLPIDVLEVGAPTLDEEDQARRARAFVQATLDARVRLNITSLNWFDLWDADSRSSNVFAHYGLLHSDLSPKPAFAVLQQAIAAN